MRWKARASISTLIVGSLAVLTGLLDAAGDGETDLTRKSDRRTYKKKYSGAQSNENSHRRLNMKSKNIAVDQQMSITEIVTKLKHFYNKQEPPSREYPTEVKLGIYVNSFYSINEQTMDYSVSMYLRQSWQDSRLAFDKFPTKLTQLRMGENSWNEIWIPDTFFRNEKGANFHEVTVNNRMLRLSRTGNLWYVTKISATLSCPMKLHKYPLDTQSCPMMFESFGYTMDTMYFSWLDSPVDIDKDLQLPQFTLEDKILYDCSQNYTAGAFPCLEIQFVLRRDIGFFLIQVYVPSVLIVILSWVSFWINVEASPARVSIGLLTVLTTTTMSAGARASLPRVSYIKAIDVWMIVCLVFVFASLIEYALVNVMSRKTAKPPVTARPLGTVANRHAQEHNSGGLGAAAGAGGRLGYVSATAARLTNLQQVHNAKNSPPLVMANMTSSTTAGSTSGSGIPSSVSTARAKAAPTSSEMDGRSQARRIDKLSRKGFPLSFLLFNLIYWIAYTIPTGMDLPEKKS